ncbi:MAG TPA: DUF1634 domain-containing protein [Candidatus Aquilonibacter sp.]|nr:DUF1634 domain-containing protein [Candidatus Aquilonibacter sp.]
MTRAPAVSEQDDTKLDASIGKLLRAGTLSSAFVILLGGVLYLVQHGHEIPDYRTFHGVPTPLHTLSGILSGAFHGESLAIIQLGLLMLIATPIARVLFSVIAFLAERDYLYVVVSGIVLAVLLYGLFFH